MFFKTIKWDVTKDCFLNCRFCLNAEQRNKAKIEELDFEDITSIIDKLNELQVEHIQFLGGEPTYRKDFIDILVYIDKKTDIKVGFNTNGVKLNRNIIERLDSIKCLKSIYFSLDGTKNIHNKIRGANIYDKIIENISIAKKNW
ncbi:MAG: radical SAM protein [bacterium]